MANVLTVVGEVTATRTAILTQEPDVGGSGPVVNAPITG